MHKFKEFIKNHHFIYSIYYHLMSFFINVFLKPFLRTDDKLILFVSYGGRHYSDSPRRIYEAMLDDERFKDYKLVWAFVDPKKYDVTNKIKIDTIKYYKTALKARCWITNVMIERALKFKGIHTYYFFTTHGILVKCDGPDLKQYKFSSLAKLQYDCCLAQSEYEKKICMRLFNLTEEKVKLLGFPKDDILVHHDNEYRKSILERLGIPINKKVILYAPTFREDTDMREVFNMNLDMWRQKLSDKYVLLYRAHPAILASIKSNDSFFIDVTSYEVVEDLMIAADLLISDYSGIIFDYCIMHKPIYLWTYDYDEYNNRRGLYFDIRKELKSSGDEEEVVDMVAKHDWSKVPEEVVLFQQKYETVYGSGTKNSLNDIYENISPNYLK